MLILEIRAGEGGSDAKDLVLEQQEMYLRRCAFHGL